MSPTRSPIDSIAKDSSSGEYAGEGGERNFNGMSCGAAPDRPSRFGDSEASLRGMTFGPPSKAALGGGVGFGDGGGISSSYISRMSKVELPLRCSPFVGFWTCSSKTLMPGDLPPETTASPSCSFTRLSIVSVTENFAWWYPGDARRLEFFLARPLTDNELLTFSGDEELEFDFECLAVRGLRETYSATSFSSSPLIAITLESFVSIQANTSSL